MRKEIRAGFQAWSRNEYGAAPIRVQAAKRQQKTRHPLKGNGQGRTLYLFLKDKTSKSTCSTACADAWPPLLTSGTTKVSGGAQKGLLGTTKRSDGTTQVTYNGHPVYRFSGDKKAGDTKGQAVIAFGARWYAVTSAGKKLGGY